MIVEGSVGFLATLKGHPDDGTINTYDMRLLVGPYWRNVESYVPKVTIDGFYSSGPDVDNYMRWRVRDLTWTTQGEFGPSQDELRIRLDFSVDVQGEKAELSQLGYYLLASGRRLGEGGLNEPVRSNSRVKTLPRAQDVS